MYMFYGMTYEEYWYGDPWMVRAYEQAFLLKQRKQNEWMWIQGAYFANAMTVAINNTFGKRKVDYLKAPLDIYPKTDAEEREEIRKNKLKLIQRLSMISARFKKKQKGTDQNG